MPISPVFDDTALIPAFCVGVSATILIIQVLLKLVTPATTTKNVSPHADGQSCLLPDDEPGNRRSAFRSAIETHGGLAVFVIKLLRTLCCLALLGLAVSTLFREYDGLVNRWPLHLAQTCVFGYTSFLAVASLLAYRFESVITGHLNVVLLATGAVYGCRDVVPIFLRSHSPADASDGVILWIELSLLFLAGVVLPMLSPRRYTPYDPSEPMEPAPIQTASLLSLALFNWVNETVWKASRVSHLPLDELPPIPDGMTTKNITTRAFPHVDPFQLRKDENILWGLLRVYRRDYLIYTFLLVTSAFVSLANPLAVNGLLSHLEGHGMESNLYAWGWILLMFVGPTLVTFTEEWYQWIVHVQNFRLQAIVTELLFEHALRMRTKAESSSDANERPDADGEKTSAAHLVGKVNNLVTSDLENVRTGNKYWIMLLVKSPIVVVASNVFVYSVLGWSAVVGFASLLVLLPLPGYLSAWIQSFQAGMMKRTDARVQFINEVLNMARMIKLFAWEERVEVQIDERRQAELNYLRKTKLLRLVNNIVNFAIPSVTMAVTFGVYTVFAKGELTASRVFSSLTAFLMIRQELHFIFYAVPICTQARVSLDRINGFMHDTELLDEFDDELHATEPSAFEPASSGSNEWTLGLAHTSFTWAKEPGSSGTQTPSTDGVVRRRFTLRIEEPVVFLRGKINLVLGPTGAGKTSLLMALLGEMHAAPQGPAAFVKLPREGGVAYAAQESWVQNETIRDNILFGSPYDEVRYNKVIQQCALERDLSLFDAGDKTEVGERGITLSGGQKARITLARAVYSSAEILLLDDVLAALDVHTGRWIVEKCFMGDLVQGRTVILVSHNVALTRPIADFVVALGHDGCIVSQGSLDKALQQDAELYEELKDDVDNMAKADQVIDDNKIGDLEVTNNSGKLVVAEEISGGWVGWNSLQILFKNTSRAPVTFWVVYFVTIILTHVTVNSQSWFLGYWASQYEIHDPSEVSVPYYLAIYMVLVFGALIIYAGCYSLFVYGSIRVSKVIHKQLVSTVLGTTLRWLDKTPTSRIIARCTADIQYVDTNVADMLTSLLEGVVYMALRVGAVMLVLPIFALPALAVVIIGGWISMIYTHAQLSVKRELSNARAPVLGHFAGALAGLVSIRAYGAQDAFRREAYARMDRYTRASLVFAALNRWVVIRVNVLGTALSAALAWYLTYVADIRAADAGFSLSMAVAFSSYILYWMRLFNDFQINANSLERIQQYMVIEQEPKSTKEGLPPAYWPASGDLRVEKLSARYSEDGPRVLHELSFEVKAGERIGIVGRTGSGKSSLTLSLLRCILTEGKVYYDGIPTDSINLDALRSNITIIPQIPELLSGTLRQNLDPFGEHDDATLNDALRAAGLASLQERSAGEGEAAGARLTLDSDVAGGGGNLSVGQRQIVALARAIVRRSKLLILDEATSAIDYDTDEIIQRSLREELGKDVTVLTVAHRLQSIMDADKIMVLDAGRMVEFASPSALLKNEGGYFRGLVDGSGDRAALYAMAGASV